MKYVCADCGKETDQSNGPCLGCSGPRIVLISIVEELWGADWRKIAGFDK